MRHDYSIDGYVNGQHVNGRGTGNIDPSAGTSEMEVDFENIPDGWDPRTVVLMCCDRALIMGAKETPGTVGMYRASGGLLSIGRDLPGNGRDGVMRLADGTLVAHVRATSATDFRGPRPSDSSRVEGEFSRLPAGIRHIPAFDGLMMQAGPNLVVVTTRYIVELEDGTVIHGTTNYPHFLPSQQVEIPYYQILRVSEVVQEFDGRHLYSKVTASTLPLTPPADDTVAAAVERVTALA